MSALSTSGDRVQSSLSTAGYTDGLGRRSIRFDREVGGMLECLDLRPELGLYESVLREAAGILATVNDDRIGRVRAIEREGRGLVVLAPLVPGQRLEELLEARSADEYAGPGIDAALGFLIQALPALSLLHGAGLVHGTIAPGRIALTPSGQVVLLDCIYAAAVDRLRLNRQALWSTLAIVAPAIVGSVRFDHSTDLRQVSLAALAIALGRPLQDASNPDAVARMLQEVTEVAQIRGGERFAADVRTLLGAVTPAPTERPGSLADATSEATRLARTLGADTCLAALTELARFQVYVSDSFDSGLPALPQDRSFDSGLPALPQDRSFDSSVPVLARPANRTVLPPDLRVEAPLELPVEDLFDAPPSLELVVPESAGVSLDLSESVEISFEGLEEPEVLELELPVDDAHILSIAPPDQTDPFDWTPEVSEPQREDVGTVTMTAVETSPAEFDWAPEPPRRPEPAAPPEPEPESWGFETTSVAAEPDVEPAPIPEWDAQAQAAPEPPTPPPGILLHRPPSPHIPAPVAFASLEPISLPPPPVAAQPAPEVVVAPPQEERTGMKVYAPPPAPPPIAVAVAVPSAVQFAPAVPSVTVVVAPAAAVQPSPTLRLKSDDSAHYVRPRGILTPPDESGHTPIGRENRSGGLPWKFVAAAGVMLAIGGFVGRSYFGGGTDSPVAAEAATPAAAPAVVAAVSGGLHIETQPTGAVVLLNGEDVGRTPLKLDDVKPGRHVVTLSTDSTSVKRTVRIEAGKVVNLDVPVYSGWVAIYSPVPLHVSSGGRSLGTTETTRLMLAPGRHELTLTNRELGYSSKQTVEIVPGEERVLNLEPKGTVNVNALPWAEVWIDGTRMGETPLANLEVPLGTREFVFKHPTHGERRLTTVITAKAPPISVDFTKPGTRP